MRYELQPATEEDKPWLDDLRRVVYAELVVATFGAFTEERHQRHCRTCWERGHIDIVSVDGARVGMIQVLEDADSIDLRKIQVHPDHQGKQLGQTLIRDVIRHATASGKPLVLSTGLKNLRAKSLYERLGFTVTRESDTHFHMRFVGVAT
ncbi:MAG: GNAT family N-acetyltransferase [Planctomycetota bacterium]